MTVFFGMMTVSPAIAITNAKITIKNCDFDGQGLDAYAINLGGTNSIVIENVTAKDYGYGLLQVPSSCAGLTVKNVNVSGCYYGLKVDYANAVTIENANIDATIGIYDSNYGNKTYTIKNSTISSIKIWERAAAKTTTFKFEGANTVGTLSTSQYAKYVLAKGATLTAPASEDYDVTTNAAGYIVKHDGSKYYTVTNFVAEYENMRFGNTLSLLFAVPQYVEFVDGCYVEFVHGDVTVKVDISEWNTTLMNGYYVVEYNGLAAKQMTDVVKVTFYDANGVALGETFTSSIQGYADKALNTAGITDAFQKVVVDMLNYGAAAQTYFGYNTDALANSILNDTQKELTAFDGTDYLNLRTATGVSTVLFKASGVRFNDSINLIFQIQGINAEVAANLTVTFKDENGTVIDDCKKLAWVEADGAWAVELETLAIADAYKVIVCEITDTNGNKLTIQDSVAAYVARRVATSSTATPEAKDLYTAFMNFADSAIAYNNGQNAN